jgi:hypothetical protein
VDHPYLNRKSEFVEESLASLLATIKIHIRIKEHRCRDLCENSAKNNATIISPRSLTHKPLNLHKTLSLSLSKVPKVRDVKEKKENAEERHHTG